MSAADTRQNTYYSMLSKTNREKRCPQGTSLNCSVGGICHLNYMNFHLTFGIMVLARSTCTPPHFSLNLSVHRPLAHTGVFLFSSISCLAKFLRVGKLLHLLLVIARRSLSSILNGMLCTINIHFHSCVSSCKSIFSSFKVIPVYFGGRAE